MAKAGASMTATGRTLTRNVTLPIVAVGAVSTKMALDYEQAFTKISAISNTGAKDVARWKEEVKGLAEATGRDPQELAEALFFLASAGLKTSEVMPTLEATAKASAVGLGEMTDIAKLTANVLNAYRKSGITAAEATDTLVAAVKAGTAEPEEFAGAMGRILPIASKAQVGFDQVAASLAALSNIGLDVNEGVTAMRGLLQALIAPTDMAREAMKKIGLSAQDLLDAFQEDGILGAMTLLEERTAKASDSEAEMFDIMRRIVPNIRALTGELALTGDNAGQVAKIFDQVTNSTGALGDAMKDTKKDAAFQLQQQLAKLKVAAIDVGTSLIPIAIEIAETLGDWAKAFGNLAPAQQEFYVKAALVLAVLGPMLRIFGSLVSLGAGVIRFFTTTAAAASANAAATTAASSAATKAKFAWGRLGGALSLAIVAVGVQQFFAALAESTAAAARWEGQIAAGNRTIAEMRDRMTELGSQDWWEIFDAEKAAKFQDEIQNIKQGLEEMVAGRRGATVSDLGGILGILRDPGQALQTYAQINAATVQFSTVMEVATGKVMKQAPAIATLFGRLSDYGIALDDSTMSQLRMHASMGNLETVIDILQRQLLGAAEATDRLSKNNLRLQNSIHDIEGGLSRTQRQLRTWLDDMTDIPDKKITDLILNLDQSAYARALAVLAKLERPITTPWFIKGTVQPPAGGIPGGIGAVRHGGGGVPGTGNVPIMAEGGEFIWAKDAVQNVGGTAELARIHDYFKRMHSGGPVGHHAGGGAGGGAGFGALIASAGQLAQQLQRMAKDAERRSQVEQQLDRVLTQIGGRFEKTLAGFSASFDDLTSQIEDLASTIADFQEGVKSGITSFASLTNLKGTPTGADPGATLMAFLQGQLGQATEFSSLIQELQAAGLDPGLIQQMAAAGPEMLTILQAIKQAGVGEVNAVWGQITSLAQTTAEALSGPLFGKQVDDLNKALAALEKDFGKLSKVFEELPKKVKKDFLDEVSELGKGLGNLARILKNIPGMQHGGTMGPSGGLAVVGEAGPELLRLPGGAQVVPVGAAQVNGGGVAVASLEGVAITGTLDVDTGKLTGRIVKVFPRMHEDQHFRAKQRKSTL